MSVGALIFAFNNEQTNYVQMAAWCAKNIKRHLGLSTAVVTNDVDNPDCSVFEKVILAESECGGTRYFEDYAESVTWYNAGRTDAYSLSPWDQTLVLDADYVVASDQLATVLSSQQDFLCYQSASSIDQNNDFSNGNNWFGNPAIPIAWATVMMFRKSPHARHIFDCMNMIKQHWSHYRELYGIDRTTYRNDYALSIALNIVSGHTLQTNYIQGNLISTMPAHKFSKLGEDRYRVDYINKEGQSRWTQTKNIDLHVMGKKDLEAIIATN